MAILGNTDISGGTNAGGNKVLNGWVASDSGAVATGHAYLGSPGGGGAYNVRLVIYSFTGSAPGTLLAQSDELSVGSSSAMAWRDFTFSTPATLVSGTTYCLGWHPSASLTFGYKTVSSFPFYYDTDDAYSGGAESSWSGDTLSYIFELSVYGDISPAGNTYTKAGNASAGSVGSGASQKVSPLVTYTKAGYSTAVLVARGIGLLNADVFLKAGVAKAGLVARGTSASLFNRGGYAVLAGGASGSALIGSEFLSPALPHELVLTPESADSFSLIPSVPGSFALTPLDEEDFVLDSHPHLDSG